MPASANITIGFATTTSKSITVGGSTSNITGSPTISQSLTLSSTDVTKNYSTAATISTPTTIDTSSVVDYFGTTLSFATVKGVVIQNTGAGTLTVGGGSNALFGTDQFTIKSGYTLPLLSPITTSGSVKAILLTPSASLSYSIIIVGT